jgi:hypothetical protein
VSVICHPTEAANSGQKSTVTVGVEESMRIEIEMVIEEDRPSTSPISMVDGN